MKAILRQVVVDPRYLRNIEYGQPRPGHPEGSVRAHIADLELNLVQLRAKGISEEQYWTLKFLIHVHDAFKAEARPNSPIRHPESHASLACKFAAEWTSDSDLLNMIQFHDVNFALWKQTRVKNNYDQDRFMTLLDTIQDWDLFLMFLILDGSTTGKDVNVLRWFIREVKKYQVTQVDESWLLS